MRRFNTSTLSSQSFWRIPLHSRAVKLLSLSLLALVCFALLVPNRPAHASITGDTVNIQFVNGPVKQVVVGPGVELPNAGPVLGAAGNAPRWNIDLDSATIRVDFIDQVATYGAGAFFLFSDLNPKINGCNGTVTGVTVLTNKPVGQFDAAAAVTFTANSVRIPIAASANLNWSPGEFIEVRLTYQAVPGCNACTPPPSDMKLWHPYDETSGTVANDIAGFNNIGVYAPGSARPVPTPGMVGGALAFDGVDDYLEVADATDVDIQGNCVLDVAEAFTVDAWIKTSSTDALQTILDKRTHPGDTLKPTGYSLFLSNGRVGFQLGTGDTFSNFVAPSAPVNDGRWHFIAVTFTRCRIATGSIYVDGNLVHSFASLSGSLSNSANLIIGKRQPAFGPNFYNGAIDELEMFKRALPAAELNAIFAAGSAGKCKNNCEPKFCDVASYDPPVYYTAEANPNFITLGNFNSSGGGKADDLVAINRNAGSVSVFKGNVNILFIGDGTFSPTPVTTTGVGANPSSAAVGDFNKDGKLDLAVGLVGGGNNVVTLLGNGDATFQAPQTASANGQVLSLIALDYDNDGNLDLAVVNNIGVRLMKGAGNGTFTQGPLLATLPQPSYVAAADFNNDGRLDLAVAHIAGGVSILLADGSGGFNPKVDSPASGAFGLTIGDFNQDGRPDIATANSFSGASNAVSVLLNSGLNNGTFSAKVDYAAGASPTGVANGDLNGDGKLDLITTDGSNARVMILPGDGAGNFGAAQPVNLKGTSSQMLVSDFNNDGKLDLAATVPAAGQAAVLLNNCTASVPVITVTPTTLSNGTVGQPFTQVFTATGGMGPYTFMQTGGTLPTGVALLPNGTLTGTPEKPGTYTFTIKVTDKNGCMGTVTITWRVFCPSIIIAPATVHNGTAGLNYLPIEQLTASGGTPAYNFVVTAGLLPTGMTLGTDGKLQGTPMQSGNFTFVVTVTDKFGCTGVREFTFAIGCQTLTIGPENTTLPGAMQEMSYNPAQPPAQTFTATGGCGQYTFSVVSGALPLGITLTASGALTGAPTQNGEFEFTIKATDKCGCMVTKTYKLTVSCPFRSLLNTKLFNTGVDNTGKTITLLTPDSHYGVTYGSVSQAPLAVTAFPGWMPNTSASQWITPFANSKGPAGEYTYRTVFPLDKCDPNSAVIEGRWMADNSGKILFNSVEVPGSAITSPGFSSWHSFTINSNFGSLNTIEFKVKNDGSATGLRVEFIRAFAKCCDCVKAPDNMVAWWPLDEPKGAVVVNDIAGGNHGTPKLGGAIGSAAPAAITGKVAGALRFAPNRFVNVQNKPALNFGPGSFSIDTWVRAVGATGNKNVIVDKFNTVTKQGYRFSLLNNALVLELGDGSPTILTFTSPNAGGFNQWRFVAVTVDRSAKLVQFYADNSLGLMLPVGLGMNIPASFGIVSNIVDLRIGLAAAQGQEVFDLDELELFNRKLEAQELESILKAGSAGKCKTCVMPKVTLHPVSQTVCPGFGVVLTAAASGAPVPVVQWQVMVGSGPWTDIPSATGTTLVVTASALKSGNKYRAVFTNPCCDAITNAATINIVQSLKCFEINPGDTFPGNGGSGSLSIVLSAGAPPTATSTASWLTIDSVDTGTGGSFANAPGQTEQSATIYYTAAANDGTGGRVGGLKVGTQNVTIVQSGANPVASVSAARFGSLPTISADSIVAAFGVGLATSVQVATTVPLPTSLGGTQLKVLDAAGTERVAPLFFISPNQINYLMPPGTASGPALVTVTSGDGTVSTGTVQIALVAPGLFTTDASGRGFPAANALLFRPDNSSTQLPVARFDAVLGRFVAVPLDFGAEGNRLFLVLFGTGIKARTDLAGVTARIGGLDAPVLFADAQGGFVGLDQINIEIPSALIGRGNVDVELTVDGQTVNVVTINIR